MRQAIQTLLSLLIAVAVLYAGNGLQGTLPRWGRAIEGTRADLFAVQAAIAKSLAQGLGTSLATPAPQAVDNEAYEAYLAALSLWKQVHGDEDEPTSRVREAAVTHKQRSGALQAENPVPGWNDPCVL